MKKKAVKQYGTRVRDEARKTNQTRHRKRRKKNYTLYYILILFLIVVTGITLSITVFFNTEKIQVQGTQTHTDQEIIGYAQVKKGDNLFRMNLEQIRKQIIEKTIDIDEVKVERHLPNTLYIELIPAEPVAVVAGQGKYHILSEGGRVIAQADSLEAYSQLFLISGIDLSDVSVGEFAVSNKQYQTVREILTAIEEAELTDIRGLELVDSVSVKLNYADRVTLVLGSMLELDSKLSLAQKLLTENITETEEGVLDLQKVGDAYFQPMTMESQKEQGKAVSQSITPADSQPPAEE